MKLQKLVALIIFSSMHFVIAGAAKELLHYKNIALASVATKSGAKFDNAKVGTITVTTQKIVKSIIIESSHVKRSDLARYIQLASGIANRPHANPVTCIRGIMVFGKTGEIVPVGHPDANDQITLTGDSQVEEIIFESGQGLVFLHDQARVKSVIGGVVLTDN